jgi:hypothetical protein
MIMRRQNHQLNLPPAEVEPVNRQAKANLRDSTAPAGYSTAPVEAINPLRWVRQSIAKVGLSQRYMACAMGISEQLFSIQVLGQVDDKHLSLRRLGKVDDVNFWREFALLILEDLGFQVVVMDQEQHAAWKQLQVAQANWQRESAR